MKQTKRFFWWAALAAVLVAAPAGAQDQALRTTPFTRTNVLRWTNDADARAKLGIVPSNTTVVAATSIEPTQLSTNAGKLQLATGGMLPPMDGTYVTNLAGWNLFRSKGMPNAFTAEKNCPDPPLIYSTWFTDAINVTESNLMYVAYLFSTNGMKAAGWDLLWIDDGWQNPTRSGGNLIPNPTKFPSGFSTVVSNLHTMGYKVGIYTSFSDQTCGLLPGTPLSMVEADVRQFLIWGFDAIKMDMCNVDGYERTQLDMTRYFAEAVGRWKMICGNPYQYTNKIILQAALYPMEHDGAPDLVNNWMWYAADNFANDLNVIAGLAHNKLRMFHNVRPGNYGEVAAMLRNGTYTYDTNGATYTEGTTKPADAAAVLSYAAMLNSAVTIGLVDPAIYQYLTNREALALRKEKGYAKPEILYATAYKTNAQIADSAIPELRTYAEYSSFHVWHKRLGDRYRNTGSNIVAYFSITNSPQTWGFSVTNLGYPTNYRFKRIRDVWNQTEVLPGRTNYFVTTCSANNTVLLYVEAEPATTWTETIATWAPVWSYGSGGSILNSANAWSAPEYFSGGFKFASGGDATAVYRLPRGRGFTNSTFVFWLKGTAGTNQFNMQVDTHTTTSRVTSTFSAFTNIVTTGQRELRYNYTWPDDTSLRTFFFQPRGIGNVNLTNDVILHSFEVIDY